MTYRADIDGLRAVAVLLVLFYHSKISLFPSGFIGVDIFFVISGFLITKIIHEAINQNNFSFITFYTRRLWRLQPVLIVLLLGSTLFAFLFFLPEDLISFSVSAAKTSLFTSNLFFNKVTSSYFAPETHQLPLLHTWSLSIEWQYYLCFPVLIFLFHYFLSNKTIKKLVFILTFFCCASSLYLSNKYPSSSYYFFFNRLFEFLIGSSLAFISKKERPVNYLIVNFLGLLALFSIFYIAAVDEILIKYPNYYALVVCLSTALLIALTTFSSKAWHVYLLSWRPIVYIGLISYSLYLWHWIVFSFIRYKEMSETNSVLIFALIVTFIGSHFSWRWIELPSRKLKIKFSYTLILLLLIPIAFTHLSKYLIYKNSGYPQRFGKEFASIYNTLNQWKSDQRPLCISHPEIDFSQCKIGSLNNNAKSAFLIGDSFSNHYWGFLDILGKDANLSVLAQGTSSCLALPDIYLFDWWKYKDTVYQDCYNQTKKYYQTIKENHFDYVILGQLWNNYYSNHIIQQLNDKRSLDLTKKRLKIALDEALSRISSSGARPVIIDNLVVMPPQIYNCFSKHIKLRQPYNPSQCSFNNHLTEDRLWFLNLFSEMQTKYPELILIDPSKVQCNEKICRGDISGVPIYRDKGHLTDYAAYQFGHMFLHQFKNPFISISKDFN